jgi:phage terminase small subunit
MASQRRAGAPGRARTNGGTSTAANGHAPTTASPVPATRDNRHAAGRTDITGKMTPLQDRFCREYITDLNAAAAARRAGYSNSYANRAAQDLLTLPLISSRIAELQAARTRRTEVKADFVLTRLVDELDARVADIYGADGCLLPVHEWPEVWQRGLVTSIQTTELYNGKERIGQAKSVVFADRVKRLELLGRHISVQAFRDKVQVGLDDPLQALFAQIKGQAIRPTIDAQPIRPALTDESEG